MLSLLVASALSTVQPAGAMQPLVVNLCNETPTRVAYSVVYPSGPTSRRRRGWLTVEPGQCLSGAIGNTTGGEALVHAMSGEYRWPSGEGDAQSCLPGNAHDSAAVAPPCPDGTRATSFETTSLAALRGRYELNHTISCDQLGRGDRNWCETGRTDGLGFAEAIRSLEVCNFSLEAVVVATAGEDASTPRYRVQGWTPLEAGQCADVWRGLTRQNVVYVHGAGSMPFEATANAREFCVSQQGDFDRVASVDGDASCSDGERLATFRAVEFGRNVSRMSLDLDG